MTRRHFFGVVLAAFCAPSITPTARRFSISKRWARMPSRSKSNAVWLINTEIKPQLDELSQAIGYQSRGFGYGPSPQA